MSELKKFHFNYRNRIRLSVGIGWPYIPMGNGFMFQLFTFYKRYQKAGIEFFSALVFTLEWEGQLTKTLYYEAKEKAQDKAQKSLLKEAQRLTQSKRPNH